MTALDYNTKENPVKSVGLGLPYAAIVAGLLCPAFALPPSRTNPHKQPDAMRTSWERNN